MKMKNKCLFILLVVMCIGYFMPTNVFAEVHDYDSFVDYSFEVNNSNYDYEFKLYDKLNRISLESFKEGDLYYFRDYSSSYYEENKNIEINGIFDFISGLKAFNSQSNVEDINHFIEENGLHGHCESVYGLFTEGWKTYLETDIYGYIPLILEEKNSNVSKKIVLATYNVHVVFIDNNFNYHIDIFLINNNSKLIDDFSYYGLYDYKHYDLRFTQFEHDSLIDNIRFMRNAIFDYSDELWESLNSGPIASSEMHYDNNDNDLSSPKTITFKTNSNKSIYSKYKSNVNYLFKVKNGNGMNFILHDISNTFSFNSIYDKDSDTYSIMDNSSDNDYSDGIKDFSKIIIDEVKNGNFSELSTKYNSITSDNCISTSCNITTYIPLILEGENNGEMAKQIVLGLMNIQYKEENGNDYYDVSLNVYNNTCELLNSNIDLDMSKLINLSRAREEDYSNDLMDKYSNGSISLEDISKNEDINSLKDKYCENVPVISLRKISNPKTWNSGVIVLIISMIVVIGSSMLIIKKRNVRE